jgi:hypothetical protein
MNFENLNEFTRNLNRKLISEKGKTLKQSWADFRPKAAWHWPGPEEETVSQPMPSGMARSPHATSARWRCRRQQDGRRNAAAPTCTPREQKGGSVRHGRGGENSP